MTGPDPSGADPTAEQLARIERRVRERIDARVRLPRRVGTAVVALALVGGGFGLLGPVLHGVSGGSSASGSSAGGGAKSAPAATASSSGPGSVRCYAGTSTDSSFTTTRLRSGETAADAVAACRRATTRTFGGSASARPTVAPSVTCRDGDLLEVFVAIGSPSTQCARYGLQPMTATPNPGAR